jgi:GNAT superfamily N-acetyltransferase
MQIRFEPVAYAEIEAEVRRHFASFPGRVDSFFEEHLFASRHYRIAIDGEAAGLAGIHGESMITFFAVRDVYRHFGQAVYARLRKLEQVQQAFVPTCDEFFLAHALDDYKQLHKQAYFFAAAPERTVPADRAHWALKLVTPADIPFVQQETGDFFDAYFETSEIFITLRDGEPAGFGICDTSKLYDAVASIGMFTIERFRGQGVGTMTIAMLIDHCRSRGQAPVAGCWYYNHLSKKTLERAGLYTGTRLLKIEY